MRQREKREEKIKRHEQYIHLPPNNGWSKREKSKKLITKNNRRNILIVRKIWIKKDPLNAKYIALNTAKLFWNSSKKKKTNSKNV